MTITEFLLMCSVIMTIGVFAKAWSITREANELYEKLEKERDKSAKATKEAAELRAFKKRFVDMLKSKKKVATRTKKVPPVDVS